MNNETPLIPKNFVLAVPGQLLPKGSYLNARSNFHSANDTSKLSQETGWLEASLCEKAENKNLVYIVPKVNPYDRNITLDLSLNEAAVLKTILANVGGPTDFPSARYISDSIFDELIKKTQQYSRDDVTTDLETVDNCDGIYFKN